MKHRRNRKVSAFSEHYPATHTVTQHPKLVTRIPNGRTLLFSASASSNGVVGYSTSQKSLEAMVQAAVDKVLSSKSGDISGDRDIMIELLIFDILSLKPILTKYTYKLFCSTFNPRGKNQKFFYHPTTALSPKQPGGSSKSSEPAAVMSPSRGPRAPAPPPRTPSRTTRTAASCTCSRRTRPPTTRRRYRS